MAKQNDIGIIGLGVMGCNLALNIAEHGFNVAGFDIDQQKIKNCSAPLHPAVSATGNLDDFTAGLVGPRAILLLVPAGEPVDSVIQELLPRLAKGDVLIDGGNSHFLDTNRRMSMLEKHGIAFIGMGISGGEHGARYGPSLMPGGPRPAYDRISRILEAIAARANNIPCVTYLGAGSAGHYVKMVHNGIEYGLMRLIAETYDFMKRGLDYDDIQLSKIYGTWSKGELASYLIEITEVIFKTVDPRTGKYLIDVILDEARQKGTGAWTSQNAMELHVPMPNIDAGVEMRDLSCYKIVRQEESKLLTGPPMQYKGDKTLFVDDLAHALYTAMLLTYVQGMALIYQASGVYDYKLRLSNVAQVWRAGCIIRSKIMEDLYKLLTVNDNIPHLLDEPRVAQMAVKYQDKLRSVVKAFADTGISGPGFMAALGYYDSFRSAWLPANLIQAQRDYFGAHTYERIDEKGTFHTLWSQPGEK